MASSLNEHHVPTAPARAVGEVTGRVRRPDGAALRGAQITTIDTAGKQCGRATTDAAGDYRAPVGGPGEYLVICAHPPYHPAAVRVGIAAASTRCDVTLAGAAALSGRVTAQHTGVPVPDALLVLIDERGASVAQTLSDETGHYRIADLAQGTYVLTVCYGAHPPVAITVELPATDTVTQDLALTLQSCLTGTVRSAVTGLPLPESLITVLDEQGTIAAHTYTDRDGTFAVDNLSEGDYTVIASGYPPTGTTLSLPAGPSAPVQMSLGPAAK